MSSDKKFSFDWRDWLATLAVLFSIVLCPGMALISIINHLCKLNLDSGQLGVTSRNGKNNLTLLG